MTWGAEGALKAMAAYQVESLRFIARRTCCNSSSCGVFAVAATGRRSRKRNSPGSRIARDYGEELSRLASTGFQLAQSDLRRCKG